MRRVIIESPYAGEIIRNSIYLNRALRHSIIACGEAPFASHRMYVEALNEHEPAERERGIEAGYAWWYQVDAIVFYTDYGMSSGMVKAEDRARKQGKYCEYRSIGLNPVSAWPA